jgi:hypothetical protein
MINEERYDRVLVSEKDPLLEPNLEGETVDLNSEKGHTVGTKSLNSFYSIVFIINQIYGPGVLAIPIVFQEGMLNEYAVLSTL